MAQILPHSMAIAHTNPCSSPLIHPPGLLALCDRQQRLNPPEQQQQQHMPSISFPLYFVSRLESTEYCPDTECSSKYLPADHLQIDHSDGRGFKNYSTGGFPFEHNLQITKAEKNRRHVLGNQRADGDSQEDDRKQVYPDFVYEEISRLGIPSVQSLASNLFTPPPKSIEERTENTFPADHVDVYMPQAIAGMGFTKVPPGNGEFLCIDEYMHMIRECRKERNLNVARNVYAMICSLGLEAQGDIGNYIVPMFVECGSLSDALQMFHMLHCPKEISWTSLIVGYISFGQSQTALNVYQKMKNYNVLPRSHTLVALLKACTRLKDLGHGHEIHAEATENGFEQDSFVGNSLISMYTRCGSIQQAQMVFNKLLVRDVFSWTSLISGYAEYGVSEELSVCLDQMKVEGIVPNVVTVSCSLKACNTPKDKEKGQQIHLEATMKGYDENIFVGNMLIAMYAKCGLLSEAHFVFSELPTRDVVSWTSLIIGCTDQGLGQESLELYDGMHLEGISANAITYTGILKACSSVGSLHKGQVIHKDVVLKGYEKDCATGNSLVSMYMKCFALPEAQKTFEDLWIRDVVSWTSLISGYVEHGHGHEALQHFDDMQLEGIAADAFTFSCSLKACAAIGALEKGKEIHATIREKGLTNDTAIGNILVDMYAKCGSPSEAQEAFDGLSHKTIVSWTSLVTGYAENGCYREVLRCFEQMQSDGVTPTAATLSCVLQACGNIGAIEAGRSIYKTFVTNVYDKDPSVNNGLISMYASCGLLVEAREIFNKMEDRDVAAWSTMIKGYGVNYDGRMAVKCFEDMLEQDMKPDSATFTCLLSACRHCSLVDEGWEFFRTMREDYGIVPTLEHYVCMVGLLAKSGRLYEAERFLERLCSCSQRTWATLLGVCKTYGEEQLASRCFQQLVQLNPDTAAWYVLMAGIYGGASMWGDATKLEGLRKHAGILKKPANALIEVNGQIHEFVAGNNHVEEISEMLNVMHTNAKGEGHMPNVDFVLQSFPDERKEEALCEHAEKLAIAFGLLHTPQGATLRVTKSLRMCNDCHDASKIISKVEKREIIIRDDCSIHRFRDGSCSCGDMF